MSERQHVLLPELRILDATPEAELGEPAILLVAQAAYHLEELIPLFLSLQERGKQVLLTTPVPTKKVLQRWRATNLRHEELLKFFGSSQKSIVTEKQLSGATALVVLNDWGTTAPLVRMKKNQGRPTFAWVEGVQDFDDVDTGRKRYPYQSVDHVFCLGKFDFESIKGPHRVVVGSERLFRLWRQEPSPVQGDRLLINLNFTYGVGTSSRYEWLQSVQRAATESGWKFEISQHVADRSFVVPWLRSSRTSSEALNTAPLFITRFSTLGYEALVRGVPMIYHNPHGERVFTFTDPDGAFRKTTSTEALIEVLKEPLASRVAVRANAKSFLSKHIQIEGSASPADLASDYLCSVLET